MDTVATASKCLNPVQIGNATLHLGDCLDVLREMLDNSVDSIVTDPPYGLSFMGKKWDYDVPAVAVWVECLRVLKPGSYLLAFAGTRTQHRMACRIEDAGFEIRDMIAWVYGSGFPKSHNGEWGGTALKPALEPITMARKPLSGTVEANWSEHGTGALNIDGCRVTHSEGLLLGGGDSGSMQSGEAFDRPWKHDVEAVKAHGIKRLENAEVAANLGRWPANLIHDGSDEVVAMFPQSAGQQGDVRGTEPSGVTNGIYGDFASRVASAARNDSGSSARFFYCAKASSEDRNEGANNTHPAVKPTDLMRYLLRMVTPPHGTALDPFLGSGSTGKAAMLEDFQFIGIERDPAYFAIACARLEHVTAQASLFAA